MRDARPSAIYLKDYRPPPFLIQRTRLEFDLHEDHATVSAVLDVVRAEGAGADEALVLHGQELQLERVELDAFDLRWGQDGSAAVLHHGEPVAIVQVGSRGYAKGLAESGAWGQTWCQDAYRDLFEPA